jgi:hypothetical protein
LILTSKTMWLSAKLRDISRSWNCAVFSYHKSLHLVV